jgi:hypothetical protein
MAFKDIVLNILERRTGNALRDATADTARLRREAAALNREGAFPRLGNHLDAVGRQVPAFARLRSTITALASGPVLALTAGIGGLAAAIGVAAKSIREFAAAEQVFDRLDAALLSQGRLTNDFRRQIHELAGELQTLTGVAGTEWLGVLQRLIQFGSNPETIGLDANVVKNLAGLVGDLTTATNLYTRALEGDFNALRRYGIQIDATATQQERMASLVRQSARGAGILEANTLGAAGAVQRLRNSTGDLLTNLGGLVTSYIATQSQIRGFTGALDAINDFLPDVTDRTSKFTEEQNDLNLALREAAEAADEAREKYEDLAELGMSAVEKATRELDAATQDGLAAQQQNIALLNEQTRATRELEIARIRLREVTGEITPEQAQAEIGMVNTRTDRELRERRTQGISGEIETRQAAIRERTAPVIQEFNASRELGERVRGARSDRDQAEASGADPATIANLTSALEQLEAKQANFDAAREVRIQQVNRLNEADRARIATLERELEMRRKIDEIEAETSEVNQTIQAKPFSRRAELEETIEGQRSLIQSAGANIADNIQRRRGGSGAFLTVEELDTQRAQAMQAASDLRQQVGHFMSGGGGMDGYRELTEIINQISGALSNDGPSQAELARLNQEIFKLKAAIRELKNR